LSHLRPGIFDPNNLADGVEASKNDKILPLASLDKLSLQKHLDEIGRTEMPASERRAS